jgi:hypothetical protein
MIEFSKGHWKGTGVLSFDRARRWFTTNYGWGQDVEVRSELLRSDNIMRKNLSQMTSTPPGPSVPNTMTTASMLQQTKNSVGSC